MKTFISWITASMLAFVGVRDSHMVYALVGALWLFFLIREAGAADE